MRAVIGEQRTDVEIFLERIAVMDREREKGRVRTGSDSGSLWIDFSVRSPKREDHLAAGRAAIPSPPDLISMFLEQAILNKKVVSGGSPDNIGIEHQS
ncbi:hypothetical protein R1flu_021155 [Riccia fluitans]|uniref:Uncharacterized protein n=1 Tax=Riccia fluitans TaxID=41844 RepID=A0ABD1ZNJ5_9MARC